MGASTCFPVSMARGATWDPDLEYRVGQVIGTECRAQGVSLFAGVCINLLRHPAWGRAQETYGEDPVLLGAMGVALVRGVQSTGTMACVKHYALNSMENARFKVDVQIDERTLREVYLPHFKQCVVDAGAASVMGAYNKLRGDHCCENAHLLREILKENWQFKGYVISDFIWGVRNGIKAVNAGLDVEMPFKDRIRPAVLKRVSGSWKITEGEIDEHRDADPSPATAVQPARRCKCIFQGKSRVHGAHCHRLGSCPQGNGAAQERGRDPAHRSFNRQEGGHHRSPGEGIEHWRPRVQPRAPAPRPDPAGRIQGEAVPAVLALVR